MYFPKLAQKLIFYKYFTYGIIKSLLTFPCASTGACFCNSNLVTLMLPYFDAKCSGVNPFLVVAVTEASFSNNTDATCQQKKSSVSHSLSIIVNLLICVQYFTKLKLVKSS